MTPSLPLRIQQHLSETYGIDEVPSVDDFVDTADDTDREAILIRESAEEMQLLVRLPRRAVEGTREITFDELCQAVEGVSHFIYLVERVRRGLPATHLELELQAEVDKYVFLLECSTSGRKHFPLSERANGLRERLFERVSFCHSASTELGQRYRFANELAAKFAQKLEARFVRAGQFEGMRRTLRHFYGAGQTGKIELAIAA